MQQSHVMAELKTCSKGELEAGGGNEEEEARQR